MNKELIQKIRKLIAHEKSCRAIGSIAEAEAFATKIQELLDEHKLGMDEVAFQEREQGEPIGWAKCSADDEDFHPSRRKQYWQCMIAQAVAKANNCRMVWAYKEGNSFYFVGRTSDRELCKIVYLYMIDLAFELADKAAREENKTIQHNMYVACCTAMDQEPTAPGWRRWMKEFRKSWFKGFSQAVSTRFYAQAAKTHKAMSETALVYIGKDITLINKEVKDNSCSTPNYNRGKVRNTSGYDLGRSTGEAVNLTPHRFGKATGRISRLLGA